MEIIAYIYAFVGTCTEVELFRRWSRRRNLLDMPNERSSHTTPTPRGGGLLIALNCLAIYALYTIFYAGNFEWSYFIGAGLVALVSWLDDLYSLSFVPRFLAHSLAAILIVFHLGYFETVDVPFFQPLNLGLIGGGLTFLWIVWLTNAYNFMDGIDGIAGMQAVTAGIGWLLIGKVINSEIAVFYGGILAFSSLGFLLWNWQPAKIFMGDVGSAFLGFSFAVLPLLVKKELAAKSETQPILLTIGVLLVWLFVFDTMWTFAGRALKGEKVWQAHRGHLYQQMVIGGSSHQSVAILYGALSILTIGAVALWIEGGIFQKVMLVILIGLQSFGLLIYARILRKRSEA